MSEATAAGPRLFHDYLLRAAAATPEAPAIISARGTWSYAELARRAGAFADELRAAGLCRGDAALLELYPCPEAIALMLACSRLGVVFVNLGPDMPAQRKRHIEELVEAKAHIAALEGAGPPSEAVPVRGTVAPDGRLALEGRLPAAGSPGAAPEAGPDAGPEETDLVYIVFTSGTTGTPKGIMMSHRAVVASLSGASTYGIRRDDRVGTVAPLQFDFSILDLGFALGNGACLVQVPSLLVQQPRGFANYLADKQVTVMSGVPSIWRETLRTGAEALLASTRLHTVFYAAEAFAPQGLRRLRAAMPSLRLVNGFGHSESILCAYKVLPEPPAPIEDIDGRVPFGLAFPGMKMTILDDRGEPVTEPLRVGELYIQGDALFDGYWKDPAQTAARLQGGVFRTGDLVFRDARGDYYFHSRKDTQIKLLGNRIELEEIDSQLATHPSVVQAASVLIDGEPPFILAHLVVDASRAPGADATLIADLRRSCSQSLPRYMLPARFEIVDGLPLSLNGKVDRRALVEKWRARASQASQAQEAR